MPLRTKDLFVKINRVVNPLKKVRLVFDQLIGDWTVSLAASTYSFVLLKEHKQPFGKNNLDLTAGQFVTFVNNVSLGLGFR